MVWDKTCVMDKRMAFIVDYRSEDYCFAELCRRYGVSRRIGYKWRDRYEAEGPAGLVDRSRAPQDRKSTRLKSSHLCATRMPPSACKKKTVNIIYYYELPANDLSNDINDHADQRIEHFTLYLDALLSLSGNTLILT